VTDRPPPIDEETRRRIREQYGDGIAPDPRLSARPGDPARPATSPSAESVREQLSNRAPRSAEQSKRAKVGRRFEEELDETHGLLERERLVHILPHYPPTVWRQGPRGSELHYRAGGAPCDFSGHVNLAWRKAHVPGLTPAGDDGRPGEGTRQVPVVFDAKVLGAGHASYAHDADRRSQLDYLELAHRAGAVAFFLIRADEVGLAFLVGWGEYGARFRRGLSVQLFEQRRTGTEVDRRLGRAIQRPTFEVIPHLPCVPYTPGRGWLWPWKLPALLG
jgi:hypothetical protein